MNVHEYQSKLIFDAYGIKVPRGYLIERPDQVEGFARRIESNEAVVKAQIHAGGRGKAGGVKIVKSVDGVIDAVDQLLNKRLITHQTDERGELVTSVYLEEACSFEKEYYFSLIFNREKACLSFIMSQEGGMEIEQVPKEAILQIDLLKGQGLDPETIHKAQDFMDCHLTAFSDLMQQTYQCFNEKEALMLEINPLVLTPSGELIALDAKMTFDDNALFRHPDIEGLKMDNTDHWLEKEANDTGLAYVKLEGNIGCLVNGAGLAMATMDAIKYVKGHPANFLDVGGSADVDKVAKGIELILSDEAVEGLFVNIFGGIMQCDTIALGLLKAFRKSQRQVPVVVRFEGNRGDYGKYILRESEFDVIFANTMDEGALKIVTETMKGGGQYEYLGRK